MTQEEKLDDHTFIAEPAFDPESSFDVKVTGGDEYYDLSMGGGGGGLPRTDNDGATTDSHGGVSARSSARSSAPSLRLKKLHANVAHDRRSAFAHEYTRIVEGKTVAFHRRLERGKGLMLQYQANRARRGFACYTAYDEVLSSLSLDVVLHAGNGLCWWRTSLLGPVEAMRLKGVCHCFAIADIVAVDIVDKGAAEKTFCVRLSKAEEVMDFSGFSLLSGSRDVAKTKQGDENFELIFTAATTHLCREMVDGFELLRKHHTQLFFTREQTSVIRDLTTHSVDGSFDKRVLATELDVGDGEESFDVKSRASRPASYRSLAGSTSTANLTRLLTAQMSRRLAERSRFSHSDRAELHSNAHFSKFGTAPALGEIDDDLGKPTFKTKQAAINPTTFHHVAAAYDPRRSPAHQHFEQQIFDKVVEVHYEAFKDNSAKIRLPNGRYFRVPTEHFCDGVWVTATVADDGFDETTNEYSLVYRDGPFEHEDGVERKIAKFPEGTIFECVHRDDIHVDIQDLPIAGFPYFIILTTLAQILLFVIWTNWVSNGSLGGPSWLALSLTSNWPKCRDYRRQIWRYVGYQFVHSNSAHITFNAIVQLLIGMPIELVHGFYRVGVIYELSVIIGAFFVVALRPEDVVVGASAGVYSLLGVHLGHTILNFHELHRGFVNRFFRLITVALLIAIDIAIAVQDPGSGTNDRARTSYAAHAGGFLSGLTLSIWFLHEYGAHPRAHLTRIVCGSIAVIVTVALIVWNATHDPPMGIFTRSRHQLYCCYQALYCEGVDEDTFGRFSCSYDEDSNENKFIVWRGTVQPDTTFSCYQLRTAYFSK